MAWSYLSILKDCPRLWHLKKGPAERSIMCKSTQSDFQANFSPTLTKNEAKIVDLEKCWGRLYWVPPEGHSGLEIFGGGEILLRISGWGASCSRIVIPIGTEWMRMLSDWLPNESCLEGSMCRWQIGNSTANHVIRSHTPFLHGP